MAGLNLVLLACLLNACSNDTLGVLGDEALAWDAPANPESVSYYEVHRNGMWCLTVPAPATSVRVAGTACLAERGQALLTVLACNSYGCSSPTDPVEFLTYACLFDPGCEAPCHVEAPRYLPERYGPCP